MVIFLLSFQAIHLSYTDVFSAQQDLLVEQKQGGLFLVIKNGMQMRQLFNYILQLKESSMKEDGQNELLSSPIVVCLTAKKRKQCEQLITIISPSLVKHLLYFKIDKGKYADCPFNRAVLVDNQICYGQGCSQLRQKQQLRIALSSITKLTKEETIWLQRSNEEIKLLRKEEFTSIMQDFNVQTFKAFYNNIKSKQFEDNKAIVPLNVSENVKGIEYAQHYCTQLFSIYKEISAKVISPFSLQNLTIEYFTKQLYRPSNYYNMAPKSWVPFQSKEISAYLFQNISTSSIYIARASKLKEHSYEEDVDKIVFGYYFSFLIDPKAKAVPQDKHIGLIKYSKIPAFQSKKAFFNIRPYIEGLQVLSELFTVENELQFLFKTGFLRSKRIHGIGSLILTSLILNENLLIKSLCEKVALVTIDSFSSSTRLLNSLQQLQTCQTEVFVCRTDFSNILDSSTYKQIQINLPICRTNVQHIIKIEQLNQVYLNQICQNLMAFDNQRSLMLKSLILHYKWKGSMINYYDFIHYRLSSLKTLFLQGEMAVHHALSEKTKHNNNIKLINLHPQLIGLLIPQIYEHFILPKENIYSSSEMNQEDVFFNKKTTQNPYLTYMAKSCSFCIYNLQFSIFTYLQWIKATKRFDLIEYMSMLNSSFQDYLIMDKRLKLITANEKNKIILIVDHIELCDQIVDKPKSIKTVMIFRLKKLGQNQDLGVISSELKRKNLFEESQEEIIKIVNQQGSSEGTFSSKFQLYDWILTSYIRLKCSLYSLDFTQAYSFLKTLHRAIATNSHRFKEIQQNYPSQWKYLYTLPIWKQNQKILLNYRLFEFIHVKELFNAIAEGSWDCKLQTNKISSILTLKYLFSQRMIGQMVEVLLKKIQQLENSHLIMMTYLPQRNNCIEIIRSLTQASAKSSNTPLSSLYHQIFPEQLAINIYDQIRSINIFPALLVVQTNQSLQIKNLKSKDTYKWPLARGQSQKIDILGKYFNKNRLYVLIGKQDHQIWLYSFDFSKSKELIKDKGYLKEKMIEQNVMRDGVERIIDEQSCVQKCRLINLQKQVQKVAEQSTQGNTERRYLFEISQDIFYIAIQASHKITIALYSLATRQTLSIKHFESNSEITYMKLIDQQLFYITNHQLIIVHLFSSTINSHHHFQQQISIQLPIIPSSSNSKTFLQVKNDEISLIFIYSHHVNLFIIKQHQILSTFSINLKNKVQVAQYHQGLLYIFLSQDTSLHIWGVSGAGLKRMKSYFWVQRQSKSVHIYKNEVLIEGRSYIKHLRLKDQQLIDQQ